jgi:hypothetical protein
MRGCRRIELAFGVVMGTKAPESVSSWMFITSTIKASSSPIVTSEDNSHLIV